MNMPFELRLTIYAETGQNLKIDTITFERDLWREREREGGREKKRRNCENVDFMVFSKNRLTPSLKYM